MEVEEQYKILVVDDSDFSRNTITAMLDDPMFNVIGEAANAKEAMNILRDASAHIAIVDIVMPEISGFELTEKLLENFPEMSIIMISSLAQENVVIDAITVGATDFLQKPFNKAALVGSLKKVISTMEEM